jgi:hypothetical protein
MMHLFFFANCVEKHINEPAEKEKDAAAKNAARLLPFE